MDVTGDPLWDDGQLYTRSNESCRLEPYDDATGETILPGNPVKGTLTQGYGHTGPDVIPGRKWAQAQADSAFVVDYTIARYGARRDVGPAMFDGLLPWRRYALIDICFEVGRGGLAKFVNMITAIRAGDWAKASTEEWQSELPRGRAAKNEFALLNAEAPHD
jgi:lysozyme